MTVNFTTWKGITDGQTYSIPDSVVAQDKLFAYWGMSEGAGTTVEELVNDHTGTIQGDISWVSNNWHEEYALDSPGDSGDHVETTPWGDFGSNMGTDYAIALTVKTTDGSNKFFGGNTTDTMTLTMGTQGFGSTSDDNVSVLVSDDNGDLIIIENDNDVNDDNEYRVVFNKISNSASDWEIWTNGTEDNVTVERDEGLSSFVNFTEPFSLFAQNDDGSTDRPIDAIMDNFTVYEDSLTSQEIEDDYNNQPWS